MMNIILTLISAISIVSMAESVSGGDHQNTITHNETNADQVLPTYTQVDNSTEKSIAFEWGTVYYTSVTNDNDHDHSGRAQTILNIRYSCKSSPTRRSTPQRLSFCGYANSRVDETARARIIAELRRSNPGKTDAQLMAMYNAEYNDRVVDPVWNITEQRSSSGQRSLQISVRQNHGEFGSCENGTTQLPIPVSCQ